MILMQDQTTNATSAAKRVNGGYYVFVANGTFGAGTVTLEYKPDGLGEFVSITDTALTAAGGKYVRLGNGQVQATLSGATAPDLDVALVRVD